MIVNGKTPMSATLDKAFAKARAMGAPGTVREGEWNGQRCWEVPSSSSQTIYRVTERQSQYDDRGRRVTETTSWWVRLYCTCPASDSGWSLCWHRAAVRLYQEQGGASVGEGDALPEAVEPLW